MSKASHEAAESVDHFIDAEGDVFGLSEYIEFLEELKFRVDARLEAAKGDLYGG